MGFPRTLRNPLLRGGCADPPDQCVTPWRTVSAVSSNAYPMWSALARPAQTPDRSTRCRRASAITRGSVPWLTLPSQRRSWMHELLCPVTTLVNSERAWLSGAMADGRQCANCTLLVSEVACGTRRCTIITVLCSAKLPRRITRQDISCLVNTHLSILCDQLCDLPRGPMDR